MNLKKLSTALILLSFLLAACDGVNRSASLFEPSFEENENSSGPSWSQVQPILKKNCTSCHGPTRATYEDAKNNANEIAKRVSKSTGDPKKMPQSPFSLTPDEINLIVAWVDAGAPKSVSTAGNLELPPMESTKKGWALIEGCTSCHGTFGVSQTGSIPNLADQSIPYLVNRLKYFQTPEAAEYSKIMSMQVAGMDEDTLLEIATHFNAIKLKPVKTPELTKEELALYKKGKALAVTCNGCHANPQTGKSVTPDIPNLKWQNSEYFTAQINAFKSGARESQQMAPMLGFISDPKTGELNDESIKALSLYYQYFGLVDEEK